MTTYNTIDDTCFLCGAHWMQLCYCDNQEEYKAKKEYLDKWKKLKQNGKIETYTLKELMERFKAKENK